ncbi:STYKc [Aspergillus sclerotialis]|uniref:non-specific serine/threonine protein kinase n=1 Tax=Aspergillus sclerotialis TaxID=2070753 RepID=A0A3A2ZA96_9EURO|nr:STYKc [Aspergillus sclerotialis]
MYAIEKFHYVPDEDVEDICMYKPGGYHPVKLGEIFQNGGSSKYRILQKLGSGSFATVWLAEDLLKGRYVALKILISDATANGNEAQILRWLDNQSRGHPGYRHVAHLLDCFQIKGPNGTHDVLIMEPMVSLFWLHREATDIISSHGKSFIHQMISGLLYLHSLQVMHGDLHLSNIGLALPDLDKYSESELSFAFDDPEPTIVLPLRPEDQTNSLPTYVIRPISLAELVLEQLRTSKSTDLCVRIMDFGNG